MLLGLHSLVCVTNDKNYFVIQCSQLLLFTSLSLPYFLYINHKCRDNIFLTLPLPILLLQKDSPFIFLILYIHPLTCAAVTFCSIWCKSEFSRNVVNYVCIHNLYVFG